MKVLKFGGSSVASPERIKEVARIILNASRRDQVVVVVSAFQGVTNQLLECARLAEKGDTSYEAMYNKIVRRHRDALDSLLGKKGNTGTRLLAEQMFGELRDVLHGTSLLRHCPPRALDVTASFGERLSALIIAAYLNRKKPAHYVDARSVIVTDDHFTQATVLFDKTNRAIRRKFKQLLGKEKRASIPVVTGFVGSTEDGRTTTIGRNGSDYTAAIVGAALNASVIEIWTDVDGVLSADPRAVPAAFVLPTVTYEEAMELSYFGASVLHSASIAPAVARKIPILIKNTMNPSAPGTRISKRADDWEGVAKGITSVDSLTLLTLRGMSMVGVPGTAERLFRALATNSVNVILISQASSEHTICFAVRSENATRARKAILHEFRFELQTHLTHLDERPEQTIVAIVGEGMKGTPGVSGKVFQALGRNNINISAIAQGASERNISFVIDSRQKVLALNVIHQAFFEKGKKLALFVIGVGNIGGTLLKQIHQQRHFLLSKGFDVQVCGIADSKRFIISAGGINLERWREELTKSSHQMNPPDFARAIGRLQLTNAALVDCTSDSNVVNAYTEFVKANLHIITPNKKANVLPWKKYSKLIDLMAARQKFFLYEANVGAGLPVISTLQDLIASGDTIVRIEGILSGTLSYLFNEFDGSTPFHLLVQKAHEQGYTEPDPRDDLSGQDVARKLLILARQRGLEIDLDDISVENLVPPALRRGAFKKSFFDAFARVDAKLEGRIRTARAKGGILRYVGVLENGRGRAGLKEFPRDHPFASTKGTDNILAFTTRRYARTPLVVQGPGAGADVTAMGVFSDILKLLNYLPY